MLVSNRGPVTFHAGGEVQRGSGGLVTALTGLASHREAIWIASAMNEHDAEVSREHGGRAFPVHAPGGGEYQVRLVVSDPDAYDRFYNVFANPMLWFIQHYLWDLSNAPDIRREEIEAFEFGYNVVNEDLARAVVEEIEGAEEPVVMVHDYHLYTLPELVRRARPDVFLHHFIHIPWTQPDAWRVLPSRIREEIFAGLLANDIIGFHTRSYRHNFLQCCRDLMDLEVDFDAGVVRYGEREVWVRAYPLPIDHRATRQIAQGERVEEFERELLRRRRDFLILRVDRADLSKNVLRGFSAFDLFLEQHPEFSERVTFMAQLMPSRTDVPQYAEYLERIEALVAVVNHRHGTPDWMPIQLKLRDDLEEAMAAYKHYDVLLVNAMFDGMNLVAKEGPIVNEREGVSILSENTGAHEELGRVRPVGQPVRHPGAGRLDLRRADDGRGGARPAGPGAYRDRHLARSRATGSTSSWPTSAPRDARARACRPRADRRLVADPLLFAAAHDPSCADIRPRAAARPAGRATQRAKIVADSRAAIECPGRAAAPGRVGRAALTYPIEKKTSAEYHLLQFHARQPGAAERAGPHPADHRRRAALSHHQARARRPAAPDMRSGAARVALRRTRPSPASLPPRPLSRASRRQSLHPRRPSPSLPSPRRRLPAGTAWCSGRRGNKIGLDGLDRGHERRIRQADRRAARLAADVRVAGARRPLARAPSGPVLIFLPSIAAAGRLGPLARERSRGVSALIVARLRAVDAVRVLAAPARVPLRARGGLRRATALDHPRRPPRPPQRPDAPGDAAGGERAAGRRWCSASCT